MVRLLLRAAVFVGSSAIGLLVASWLVTGVSVSLSGFTVAVVVFAVAQAILSPFVAKMASRYASAFLGGIGLVPALIALILASVLTHGVVYSGIGLMGLGDGGGVAGDRGRHLGAASAYRPHEVQVRNGPELGQPRMGALVSDRYFNDV